MFYSLVASFLKQAMFTRLALNLTSSVRIMFLINIDKKGQAYLLFFIDSPRPCSKYTWYIWLYTVQCTVKKISKQIVPTQFWKVYCLPGICWVEGLLNGKSFNWIFKTIFKSLPSWGFPFTTNGNCNMAGHLTSGGLI